MTKLTLVPNVNTEVGQSLLPLLGLTFTDEEAEARLQNAITQAVPIELVDGDVKINVNNHKMLQSLVENLSAEEMAIALACVLAREVSSHSGPSFNPILKEAKRKFPEYFKEEPSEHPLIKLLKLLEK